MKKIIFALCVLNVCVSNLNAMQTITIVDPICTFFQIGGATDLELALDQNRNDLVETLINQHANVREKDSFGNFMIHHARNLDAAKMLVKAGADINAVSDSKHTLLAELIRNLRIDRDFFHGLIQLGARLFVNGAYAVLEYANQYDRMHENEPDFSPLAADLIGWEREAKAEKLSQVQFDAHAAITNFKQVFENILALLKLKKRDPHATAAALRRMQSLGFMVSRFVCRVETKDMPLYNQLLTTIEDRIKRFGLPVIRPQVRMAKPTVGFGRKK